MSEEMFRKVLGGYLTTERELDGDNIVIVPDRLLSPLILESPSWESLERRLEEARAGKTMWIPTHAEFQYFDNYFALRDEDDAIVFLSTAASNYGAEDGEDEVSVEIWNLLKRSRTVLLGVGADDYLALIEDLGADLSSPEALSDIRQHVECLLGCLRTWANFAALP